MSNQKVEFVSYSGILPIRHKMGIIDSRYKGTMTPENNSEIVVKVNGIERAIHGEMHFVLPEDLRDLKQEIIDAANGYFNDFRYHTQVEKKEKE